MTHPDQIAHRARLDGLEQDLRRSRETGPLFDAEGFAAAHPLLMLAVIAGSVVSLVALIA